MYYVKIEDEHFFPDMYPLDMVVPCNAVFAKWVIDHSYGVITDAGGTPISDPLYTPVAINGVVKEAAPSDVVIEFSTDIAVTDATGIIMRVAGSNAAITGVSASGRGLTVVMTTPIVAGQDVNFLYTEVTGNITNATWTALEAKSANIAVQNAVEPVVVMAAVVHAPIPPEPVVVAPPILDPIPQPFGP